MSRTLRRPMFRGGRVSAYGTGIAHGLADGGMPPKRGLVTGPGGYAGQQDYSGIMRPYPIYHSSMGQPQGSVLGSDLMNFVKQNPKYGSLQFANTLNANQSYSPTTYGGSRRGPQISDSPEFLKLWQNYMDPETTLIDPDQIDVETGEVTGSVSGDAISGSEGEISTTSVDDSAAVADEEPGKIKKISGIDDDDPTVVEESDLASMVSRYEDLLGGKKAKGKDISDMLLRFAGSEGDTTMEKFQKFAAKEADIPSRTEKIKQAASMLGIKYEQAKDIAAITALGKRFSPGITEKTAKYIKSLPKGSAEHATALAQIKWPSTLDRKITEAQMSGDVTLDDINVWAGVYIDNYKGKLTEDSVNGVFLNTGDSTLIWVDENGVIGNKKQLNVK